MYFTINPQGSPLKTPGSFICFDLFVYKINCTGFRQRFKCTIPTSVEILQTPSLNSKYERARFQHSKYESLQQPPIEERFVFLEGKFASAIKARFFTNIRSLTASDGNVWQYIPNQNNIQKRTSKATYLIIGKL